MKAYREWLPASGYEANASIGGSYYSNNVEDFYLTPWDLGYGSFVKFDHDFIGRDALEKKASMPHRRKVTLALDNEDVARVMSSMFQKGKRAKYIDFPSAVYSMHPYDSVLANGKFAGISTWIGYSSNEGRMLTLAMVDEQHAKPGTQGGAGMGRGGRRFEKAHRRTACSNPYQGHRQSRALFRGGPGFLRGQLAHASGCAVKHQSADPQGSAPARR